METYFILATLTVALAVIVTYLFAAMTSTKLAARLDIDPVLVKLGAQKLLPKRWRSGFGAEDWAHMENLLTGAPVPDAHPEAEELLTTQDGVTVAEMFQEHQPDQSPVRRIIAVLIVSLGITVLSTVLLPSLSGQIEATEILAAIAPSATIDANSDSTTAVGEADNSTIPDMYNRLLQSGAEVTCDGQVLQDRGAQDRGEIEEVITSSRTCAATLSYLSVTTEYLDGGTTQITVNYGDQE